MANFIINPKELEQGMLDPERVTSASGDIFEEQGGITPEQVAALDSLTESLIGPEDEGGSFDSLGDIVERMTPEQAALFIPTTREGTPEYLIGALPGDLPSGDPDEYDPMAQDPYYAKSEERIEHPGTFEEYIASQPEHRRAGVKFQEKRFFLQSQFPDVEGDISKITSSKKIQDEILSKADEYAESKADISYHQILTKEYQAKIQPILESLNYIEDKDDYDATLSLLSDIKTSTSKYAPEAAPIEQAFSNEAMKEFFTFPKERQDVIMAQLSEKEKNELLGYKNIQNTNTAELKR